MKKVVIKRLFHGVASARDYLVSAAKNKQESLLLVLEENNEEMLIPWEKLSEGKKDYHQHKSKHDGRYYYLVDFIWRPTLKQKVLL